MCLLVLAGSTTAAMAAVKLPAVIGDNMVLQRGQPLPIWGWADNGEEVRVALAGQVLTAKTGDDGRWKVVLAKLDAGRPLEMTVQGSSGNLIKAKNILVGEVWLCSGQSNMAMRVSECNNATDEMAEADHPQIRLLTVPPRGTQEPQLDFNGQWVPCSPTNVGSFSAAAYFFGRKLQKELNVPIGLINISQGSSSIETWMAPESLEANQDLIDQNGCSLVAEMHRFERFHANYDLLPAAEKERVFREHCQSAYGYARQFLGDDGKPKIGNYPDILLHMERVKPAWLYRLRIAPVIPFGIRGVLWYQGETNIGDKQYARKQQILIDGWRKLWRRGDFPFYFVQVAPYRGYAELPDFWLEQYRAAQNTPHCELVSTVDIGELDNFHPTNKRDVGLRLALLALHDAYGKADVIASGPTYKSIKIDGPKVLVEFDNAGSGLMTKDGHSPSWFEVAGVDGQFVKADAAIQGSTVVLRLPMERPVYVRYAWNCLAEPNLYNKHGLPALPFNTAKPFFHQGPKQVGEERSNPIAEGR